MVTFAQSKAAYESWLKAEIGDGFLAADLERKNEAMRESAFVFLRGTYWRWAEIAPQICPDVMSAPTVLAVGDIHLENFGTWRDAEGRVVWGVNDFDEAATMPFTLDLVRLAASALLGGDKRKGAPQTIGAALLAGYTEGVKRPRPVVLEREWAWLREMLVVPEDKRAKFWKKLDALRRENAPAPFRSALAAAMPEEGVKFETARRVAGTGSLGRPRWVGIAEWRGAAAVREAKALVTSAWELAHGNAKAPIRCGEIAAGPHRAPDPWYRVLRANDGAEHTGIVVRRLSPNNRKLDADRNGDFLLSTDAHGAMGLELANLHLGTGDAAAILADLAARKKGWLAEAAEATAAAINAEWKEFRKS